MTLEDIRQRFRSGELTAEQAVQELTPHLLGRTVKAASVLLDEILGMPEEPKAMTASERSAAKTWEKNYRG